MSWDQYLNVCCKACHSVFVGGEEADSRLTSAVFEGEAASSGPLTIGRNLHTQDMCQAASWF